MCAGRKFVLQGGDCAEAFIDCTQDNIEAKLFVLLQTSFILSSSKVPIVCIGRFAGQYMKPRSKPQEVVDGELVWAYKGDSINSFDLSERDPNPDRLLQAYFHAAATMNFTRSVLLSPLFAQPHERAQLPDSLLQEKRFEALIKDIEQEVVIASETASPVMGAIFTPPTHEVFTSHEGLLLPFEEAMTRQGPNGQYYNVGAHFLWIGDRTRQPDGAHIEYFRGIANPVGCKIGSTVQPTELVQLIRLLNPHNIPGKLVLITRLGAANVGVLPALIAAVVQAGIHVVWQCDPMHGNTVTLDSGVKTRHFSSILKELVHTFDAHAAAGTWLGGVHVEQTGNNVTECVGGVSGVLHSDVPTRYESFCDPRLNNEQSLELALVVAQLLKRRACSALSV